MTTITAVGTTTLSPPAAATLRLPGGSAISASEGARLMPVLRLRAAAEVEVRKTPEEDVVAVCDCLQDQLIEQMRDTSPPALQGVIHAWIEQFLALQTAREQAEAWVFLLHCCIEPVLFSTKDLALQEQLLGWEERTQEILRQILPAEYGSVDALIDACVIAIEKGAMMRALAVRVEETARIKRAALHFVAQSAHQEMQEVFSSLKQRLLDLQALKKMAHQQGEVAVESVSQELRGVSEELRRQAVALDALGEEMRGQQAVFHKSLDECRLILERILS